MRIFQRSFCIIRKDAFEETRFMWTFGKRTPYQGEPDNVLAYCQTFFIKRHYEITTEDACSFEVACRSKCNRKLKKETPFIVSSAQVSIEHGYLQIVAKGHSVNWLRTYLLILLGALGMIYSVFLCGTPPLWTTMAAFLGVVGCWSLQLFLHIRKQQKITENTLDKLLEDISILDVI